MSRRHEFSRKIEAFWPLKAVFVQHLNAAALSQSAIHLAEGVLQTMFISKLKTVFAAVFVLGLFGVGTGVLSFQPEAAEALPVPVPAQAVTGGQPDFPALLKKRRDLAQIIVDAQFEKIKEGRSSITKTHLEMTARLLESELELSENRKQRITACDAQARRMKNLHEVAEQMFQAGMIGQEDRSTIEYFRVDAEIRLEREKAK